ncbi:hypothetical protein P152DRAFT_457175 [Eremomyces bilateralis CBS 781.70]|uniref:Uncharacterized protein n=1 Tax=Eremomyces bilateralis CBS 781.70 TaxID=1392243 RepID=A0A6G1G798_9PEZI|nr:uncharacterized protein P152DRAFT_457175 [Eremomyces bilateralis CBS 781.70]KAF1813806.1 hypothetical protein P152DRAFT_457175 [Eremomyces bilateralis CBS 781.70]
MASRVLPRHITPITTSNLSSVYACIVEGAMDGGIGQFLTSCLAEARESSSATETRRPITENKRMDKNQMDKKHMDMKHTDTKHTDTKHMDTKRVGKKRKRMEEQDEPEDEEEQERGKAKR